MVSDAGLLLFPCPRWHYTWSSNCRHFLKNFLYPSALTSDQSSHHFTRKSLCNCCSLCRPDFSAGLVSWVFSPMNLFNFRFCPLTSYAAGSATVRNQIFFKGKKGAKTGQHCLSVASFFQTSSSVQSNTPVMNLIRIWETAYLSIFLILSDWWLMVR